MSSNGSFIYLISGILGSGKSSLSKMINKEFGFALVHGDSLFGPLENIEELSWEDRLRITWLNIAQITKIYLENDLNTVIDFVVEDELQWFVEQMSDWKPRIKYCQLIADEEALVSRLTQRDGDTQYLKRSLELLHKLKSETSNTNYLIDASGKNTRDVLETFIRRDRFWLK